MINNKGVGPFGKKVEQKEIELGDIIQLSFDGKKFSHSLIVVRIEKNNSLDNIRIATHSFNSYDKKVSDYIYEKIRFIHIEGVRK